MAVEGGVTGENRALQNGLKLPGEKDAYLIAIGAQIPESQQIDVLNIFNDSSQQDLSGTMTQTTLRGYGMAPDLTLVERGQSSMNPASSLAASVSGRSTWARAALPRTPARAD